MCCPNTSTVVVVFYGKQSRPIGYMIAIGYGGGGGGGGGNWSAESQ